VEFLYYVQSGNEWNRLFALLAFAFAALSDGLDGYIARRYNQKTKLGTILDPIADKLLLVSSIVLLSFDFGKYFPRIPLWLTGIIISRDVIILIGVAVVHFTCGKVVVRAHLAGKIATVFQIGMVLWILFEWTNRFLPFWIYSAAIFTAVSGMIYIFDGIRQLNAHPSSASIKHE
jgi:CDP-diacylglycerol--glycerol-3-phosphate 3-phosphatidyltransferase